MSNLTPKIRCFCINKYDSKDINKGQSKHSKQNKRFIIHSTFLFSLLSNNKFEQKYLVNVLFENLLMSIIQKCKIYWVLHLK